MQSTSMDQWFRRFLLAVTAAIFIGSVFELILVDHTEETLQWIPFIISAIGTAAVLLVWIGPGPRSFWILRLVMILAMAASLLGVWLHFYSNLEFTREINPSYTLVESIWPAMKGGHPLMAPGVLFLAGILGYGATWKHPALRD